MQHQRKALVSLEVFQVLRTFPSWRVEQDQHDQQEINTIIICHSVKPYDPPQALTWWNREAPPGL